ncbi:hypothetical protein CONCODRAFT_83906 [Conidiobolus coronatus NRRL 28638]|uniref:HIG1 domain-containing protein n=1 Tax=Conidiobolus coronatus (strain ATCC 28846 / CBS 209.66 / NRRL 28638) TaxID=796925 RepID=A0A137PCL0_CONC2|nr:hypothetical protein CONCODRAFT_83906 [Conidiobolus coronatus NRRL 28638]|eukprot:KXN72723.1 hypothetical protein CONCODRAFT_83906 [Conidiobolus coronatus NRRL 28638]
MTTHITENDKKINSVIFKAGAEGALIGLAGGLAAVAIGNRFSPVFKGFTIQFKAFLISAAATCSFVIKGEKALIKFNMDSHSSPELLKKNEPQALTRIPSITERSVKFILDRKYYFMFGTWLGGMSIAGAYLYRKKYMTTSQKLVEARMWAQAITLGSLAAVAAYQPTMKLLKIVKNPAFKLTKITNTYQ